MTKQRPPLSIDAALARIAGHLGGGWDEMAQLTARQPRTVRNWGDPDTPEQIPMDCAIVLDIAFQSAGGVGAPICEVYTHKLEMAGLEHWSDRITLGNHAVDVIKEAGEAHAALVLAAQPGSTDLDFRRAEREVEEALEVLRRTLPLIAARLAGQRHQTDPPVPA